MARHDRYLACPPLESFGRWQQGTLPADQVEVVIGHVERCANCQHTLETLLAEDPVSQHLRRALPSAQPGDRVAVDKIVQRMRHMGDTPTPPIADTDVIRRGGTSLAFLEPPQADDEIGRLGPFSIQRLLGKGGMGLVFQARDPQLQRPVALKVMRPEAELKPDAHERFLREARAAAAVRHDHIVTIYQVGETNGVPFLAMELLQGQSLEMRCQKGPPLAFTEIVRIGREVAEGLVAAHTQGLTHRDIKPDNIWLEKIADCGLRIADSQHNPQSAIRNPQFRVKLLDFGLARLGAEVQLTQTGLIVGTPAYMAPEQASGGVIDGRSDLFSLGSVLYRLAAGHRPFPGDDPLTILRSLACDTPVPLRRLNADIPESFSSLVDSLLEKRPEDRPASARAVADALAAIQQEQPPPRRRRVSWLVGAAALVGLALAAVTVLRVQTDRGEVVIQSSDPEVAVMLAEGRIQLHDRGSGKKYSLSTTPVKTPSGAYELEVTDEPAGLTFSTRQFTLKRGETLVVQVSFEPRKVEPLSRARVPADGLQRRDIPAELLSWAGKGDAARAPTELVAVLGGPRYFPATMPAAHYLCTRYSRDGRWLATCAGQDVYVYEAATGRVVWRLPHDKFAGWLGFRPDNKMLAVNARHAIELWDLQSGKSLGRLCEQTDLAFGITFTPDGDRLVSVDNDGKARLRDVVSKKVLHTYEPPEGRRFTRAPQISPDGKLLALHASGSPVVVLVLDLLTGDVKAEVPGSGQETTMHSAGYQNSVQFSPDGRLLASVQNDQATVLWDVATWKEKGRIEGGASFLKFSDDGQTLLRGSTWNTSGIRVTLEDVKTCRRKARHTFPLAGDFAWCDLSPDGRSVAVRTPKAFAVAVYDAATGVERFPMPGQRGPVNSLALSPDGTTLVSAGNDHRAVQWDLRGGKMVRELAFEPTAYQRLTSAAVSGDGKWLAAAKQETSVAGWIRLWEAASGKEIVTLNSTSSNWHIPEFAFHPRGGSLITSAHNRLERWTLPGGVSTIWEETHDHPIETLAIHPQGHQVAAGDRGGFVCLWDLTTYKRVRKFRCQTGVTRVRFSPDGRSLGATTAAPDSALYVWDVDTGTRTRRVGHTDSVLGLAWRPDSQELATTGFDATVRLWSSDPEKEARTIKLPLLSRSVVYTPEGRHLLTANEDGSIYVLRLQTAR